MPSLLEALERKYGQGGGCPQGGAVGVAGTDDVPVAIFVPRRPPRLSVPTLLILNDADIDAAGDAVQLVDKCADVEELDLAKNKLTKWEEVFGILQHMPQVKFVNLSFNRLTEQLTALNNLRGINGTCWSYLNNLVLNSTRVDWSSVQLLLKLLPVLDELHLSLNEYSYVNLGCDPSPPVVRCERKKCIDKETADKISSDDNQNITGQKDSEQNNCERLKDDPSTEGPVHAELKTLHFSGNPVESWREICKLGYAFPNLQSLVLNECPIFSLELWRAEEEKACSECRECKECGTRDEENYVHDAFKHLRFLSLNNARLSSWTDVDRLSAFPNLTSLRLQGWPLWEACESTEHERRQLLLARLPRVLRLNGGGDVPATEREDAERAFVRYYMDRAEADRPDRYWELVGVHGKLDPLVHVDLRPEKRVRVSFTCGDFSEMRAVDVYRTVSDLKCRLERLVGIPAARMKLYYVDQELRDFQGPEEMRYPTKKLYSYNIRSGDEIIIDAKPSH